MAERTEKNEHSRKDRRRKIASNRAKSQPELPTAIHKICMKSKLEPTRHTATNALMLTITNADIFTRTTEERSVGAIAEPFEDSIAVPIAGIIAEIIEGTITVPIAEIIAETTEGDRPIIKIVKTDRTIKTLATDVEEVTITEEYAER